MPFLGRTLESWFKLVAFYIVYYAFLTALFYFYVSKYQSTLPKIGGTQPYLQSRLDTPGLAAWPFNAMNGAEFDGDNSKILLDHTNVKYDKSGNKFNIAYVNEMVNFLKSYKEINPNAIDCGNKKLDKNVETAACKVDNADKLDEKTIKDGIKKKEAYVTLALNKIYGWKPFNRKLDVKGIKESFQKDSVYFDCFEIDFKTADKVENSKFNLEFVGEAGLKSYYFPYMGNNKQTVKENKIEYQKPFSILKISSKRDAAAFDDNVEHFFRCNVDADNVDYPVTGSGLTKENKSWSNDLNKLTLGFTQFGIGFKSEASKWVIRNKFYLLNIYFYIKLFFVK